MSSLFKNWMKILLLALVYFIAARLGLMLDAVAGIATSVWPPTGIALAALLIFGYGLWPGIALGAIFANYSVGVPWPVALGIGAGNTLEALLGAFLLNRYIHFHPSLERLRDALGLIGLAAFLSTMVSATVGVGSGWLGGIISFQTFWTAWWTWWLGDMMGSLVFAPFLLAWSSFLSWKVPFRRVGEFLMMILAMVVVTQIAFGVWIFVEKIPHHFIYLVFTVIIWAALRFGPRGASTAVLVVSALAIWDTIQGLGPFVRATLNEGLFSLQFFIGTVASTTLILASVFQERIRAEKEAKKTNIELQRLSELKSEFAGVVAHELKTPLTVIKEGIGMVLDGVDGPVNESQRGTLGLARNNVDRLGRLINNVLTYERLESGKMELEFEKISLNELVQEVFQFMEWAGLQKNLKMHLQTPQETIWACCDSDKIKEVLINLIDNSFKNTPSGGEVRIEMRGGEKEILFQVEDTGIGIPKKDQEEIFKMFRQASAPGTVKIPGAGIGLTVCKLIVELHQGKISVESELGRGTKFTVRIPKGEAVPAV